MEILKYCAKCGSTIFTGKLCYACQMDEKMKIYVPPKENKYVCPYCGMEKGHYGWCNSINTK